LRQTNSLSFVFIGSEKEKENKKNNRIRPFWLFKMQNERNAFDNVKTTKTIGFALYLPGILQTVNSKRVYILFISQFELEGRRLVYSPEKGIRVFKSIFDL
jgi:hypothetical protein